MSYWVAFRKEITSPEMSALRELMSNGKIRPRVSIIAIAVFVIFTILLLIAYFASRNWQILLWGIPPDPAPGHPCSTQLHEPETVFGPYPLMRETARSGSVINPGMIGDPVKIEEVVERVYFQFLNRPQYLIADRSGEISLKMFTSLVRRSRKAMWWRFSGLVMKRYVVQVGI